MTRERQRTLFDSPELPWEEEGSAGEVFAHVVFNRPLRVPYVYSVPADLTGQLLAGKRVLAPFGKGNTATVGYCVGLSETPGTSSTLKPIRAVLDEKPLLSPKMLELTRWIAEYYYCGWGQVLEAVLPRAVKQSSGTRWTELVSPVPEDHRPQEKLTPKQQRAFDALCQFGRPVSFRDVSQAARCGREVVKSLIRKGWATTTRQRVTVHAPELKASQNEAPLKLNPDQQDALKQLLNAIEGNASTTYLLHGVTGSGKTEVYLQAIAGAVALGREAIVLVPEISLTPQTIDRFQRRFPHVAVLHSHLSDVDRYWHWRRIANGEVQVVVGARSALFAPCRNLGLIVIDEEHETTFKQESTPRYHAVEVARKRAQLERCPLVLGSATPSLESWYAARKGDYQLLSLPRRVANQAMPQVATVDLRFEFKRNRGLRALSEPLYQAIRATVETGGQVILLLNRRGFSTSMLCPQCGHVMMCEHCEITLTFHRKLNRLLCHFCDAEFDVPQACPKCRMPAIHFSGFGTEKLEEEVAARFPNYRCERMDSDTMRSPGHYERVLTAFRHGEIHILLGTQMIAKGLDFPNVHLVGVISADTARHLPDFRASERTFQLIAQVAGRTGRGQTPGKVLVQTFCPDDAALQAACRHDYRRFVAYEGPIRQEFGYPPFEKLSRVIVRSKSEKIAQQASHLLADRFSEFLRDSQEIRILGPAPAPVSKLRDYYRMHFQIHSKAGVDRSAMFDRVLTGLRMPGDSEYQIDIDPVSLL